MTHAPCASSSTSRIVKRAKSPNRFSLSLPSDWHTMDWKRLAVVFASTAAAGAFTYACYRKFMDPTPRPSTIVKSDGKKEVAFNLGTAHRDWLQDMTDKYDLPTLGKALRIVILYAKQQGNDEEIFEKVTGKPGKDIVKNVVKEVILLDKEHDTYLEQAVAAHKLADKDEAVGSILEYAISRNDNDTIFGVKRCKHASTCACAQ